MVIRTHSHGHCFIRKPSLSLSFSSPSSEALFNYAPKPWGPDMLLKQIHQSDCITKGKVQSNKEQFLQHCKCALPLLEVGNLRKMPGDGRKYTSEVFSDLFTVFLNMQ